MKKTFLSFGLLALLSSLGLNLNAAEFEHLCDVKLHYYNTARNGQVRLIYRHAETIQSKGRNCVDAYNEEASLYQLLEAVHSSERFNNFAVSWQNQHSVKAKLSLRVEVEPYTLTRVRGIADREKLSIELEDYENITDDYMITRHFGDPPPAAATQFQVIENPPAAAIQRQVIENPPQTVITEDFLKFISNFEMGE